MKINSLRLYSVGCFLYSATADNNQIKGAMEAAGENRNPEFILTPFGTKGARTGNSRTAKDVGAGTIVLVVPADAEINSNIITSASTRGVNVYVRKMYTNDNGELIFGAAQPIYQTPQALENFEGLNAGSSRALQELKPVQVDFQAGSERAKRAADKFNGN